MLVDEFQDTDPVQWQVLDRAFTGHATLVLIGDPKQAIYAFRGGDVFSYLSAAEPPASSAPSATNWRSDRPLVDALQALLAARRWATRDHRPPGARRSTTAAAGGRPTPSPCGCA